MVVSGEAGVLQLPRLPRVPCFPVGVGDVRGSAPPRARVSWRMGVLGASVAWVLVVVGVVAVGRRSSRAWVGHWLLWFSGCGDLGCPPTVGGTTCGGV